MKTSTIAALVFATISLTAPAQTIPNHAIANLVLGQPDFTTKPALFAPSPLTMSTPYGVAEDPVTGKIFVADRQTNRVLRYRNVADLSNGAGAEALFGQARFSSNSTSNLERDLNVPQGIFMDRYGRLWVADTRNNRILMFEVASYRSDYPYPDKVFGQPDFLTTAPGTTREKMDGPFGVCVDADDRLWVADSFNNRVLRFDSITAKSSGAFADAVLGQVDFTTSATGSGSSGFQLPTSVAVSAGGSLFVACYFGNRVLRFNNAATLANGAGANAVLGQPDFNSTATGTSNAKLNVPGGVWITPKDSLWVCDAYNHRTLRFDRASTLPNGAAATGVVGQPDFTTATANTTNRGLNYPFGIPFVDSSSNLWIPDYLNDRVLRFPPDVTKPVLTVSTIVPKATTRKKLSIRGTANDTYGISKVWYRVGAGPLKSATGTSTWKFTTPLAKGKNRIYLYAVDSVGNRSGTRSYKVRRN